MKRVFLSALAAVLLAGRANAADKPSYTRDVKPFLKTYCLDCHGGRTTKKGISVESFETIMKVRSFVVPGNPERSRLYLTMTGGGKLMPPRKYGMSPTKDEIAMIKAWIAAGAKDDRDAAPAEKKGAQESREEAAATGRERRELFDPHGAEE